jgi:hypothetical protein
MVTVTVATSTRNASKGQRTALRNDAASKAGKAGKTTTGRQVVTVSEPTWADVTALVEMATGAATIEHEQGTMAAQAAAARDRARALKVRGVYLVAAHPEGKGKPTNASYAARMTGFPRTTVNDLLKAGQNSMDKGVFDMTDMLGGVSDKELDTVNKFYADGIAAKRREERAAAKAAKQGAKGASTGTGEGDDQSSAGKTDGITGALVVDGLKLAANRCKEFAGSKVTLSKKELAEALAYAARITAWAEDVQADAAAHGASNAPEVTAIVAGAVKAQADAAKVIASTKATLSK